MSAPGADASQQNRRVHLSIMPGSKPGTVLMRLTALKPSPAGVQAALISRGMLMGETLDIEVVSDASKDPSLRGIDGKSAYQLARDNGYGGTLTAWLASLVGGNGASAYDIARELGYGGTKTQWLATLKGDKGDKGDIGPAAATLLGSVTLAENNLLNISAGVRRRTIAAGVTLPVNTPLLLLPKAPPPVGYIVQATWAASTTQLTVDLTTPAITILSSYAIDCWLLRLNV